MPRSETRVHPPTNHPDHRKEASSETWASGTFPANALGKANGASFPIPSENGPNRTDDEAAVDYSPS